MLITVDSSVAQIFLYGFTAHIKVMQVSFKRNLDYKKLSIDSENLN